MDGSSNDGGRVNSHGPGAERAVAPVEGPPSHVSDSGHSVPMSAAPPLAPHASPEVVVRVGPIGRAALEAAAAAATAAAAAAAASAARRLGGQGRQVAAASLPRPSAPSPGSPSHQADEDVGVGTEALPLLQRGGAGKAPSGDAPGPAHWVQSRGTGMPARAALGAALRAPSAPSAPRRSSHGALPPASGSDPGNTERAGEQVLDDGKPLPVPYVVGTCVPAGTQVCVKFKLLGPREETSPGPDPSPAPMHGIARGVAQHDGELLRPSLCVCRLHAGLPVPSGGIIRALYRSGVEPVVRVCALAMRWAL